MSATEHKGEKALKKWTIIELVVLVVLLATAAVVFITMATPTSVPEAAQTQPTEIVAEATTEATTMPEETTVPEPTELDVTWMVMPEDYQLTCDQYFVYDCDADAFTILSGQEHDRVYPASITKLFSIYVASQYLSPETLVTVGDELDMVHWDSSISELSKGDVLTVEQLIEGMLMTSGNDASYTLATAAGRAIFGDQTLSPAGAVEIFVEEMNRQTQLVGMTDSHFVNPDGIHDDNHYMSLRDMVTLGKLSMENPTVLQCARTSRKTVELVKGSVLWRNTNELTDLLSEYYCPYAVGLKTGQTSAAGCCLLSGFVMPERMLIIGVFKSDEVTDRFVDTLHLLNQELGIE